MIKLNGYFGEVELSYDDLKKQLEKQELMLNYSLSHFKMGSKPEHCECKPYEVCDYCFKKSIIKPEEKIEEL